MTERDRLAALLHDVAMEAYAQKRWAQAPWPTDMYDWLADRLIAAGVGFAATAYKPYSWTCPECGTLVTSIVRPDLDVERLARALDIDWTPFWDHVVEADHMVATINRRRFAAAIAAAYREDAG